MCDEFSWHDKTFLVQLYQHLAIIAREGEQNKALWLLSRAWFYCLHPLQDLSSLSSGILTACRRNPVDRPGLDKVILGESLE